MTFRNYYNLMMTVIGEMVKYILKKTIISIVALWAIITVSFILLHMLPGNPFGSLSAMDRDMQLRIMNYYGLDQPIYKQYYLYCKGLLQGDFGYSLKHIGKSVNEVILESFPYSAILGLQAYVFGVPLGILLGSISAMKNGKYADYALVFFSAIGTSVPIFIIGTLLQYVFAIRLSWFPIARWHGYSSTILPSLTLSIGIIANKTRMMRTLMLETISEDYIRTAQAKGIPPIKIVFRHQIRNAIVPLVSTMGVEIAAILMGSFVVEQIYAIPGLGAYYVSAIQNLDYTMTLGLTVFYSTLVIITNLIVDVLYGVIDPRIRVAK